MPGLDADDAGLTPQAALPPEPFYLPFEAGPHRMAMGLVARRPDELIELDQHYPREMAERRSLLAARHAEVFAACPGSEAARTETLGHVAAALLARYPSHFQQHGPRLHNRLTCEAWDLAHPPYDPLELAGRLVQEDLCLIQDSPAGPVLQAALLCAPSRWSLHEKIGRPLAGVHGNVPLYAEHLAAPVDRLMRHLKPGKLAERLNWSVLDDPALFQPGGKYRSGHNPGITAANAGDTLVLRVERQTLSRLPASGVVLFTIRVHVYPLRRVAAHPGAAARLAAALRALPPEMAAYKSLPPFQAAVLGYLDSVPEDGVPGEATIR